MSAQLSHGAHPDTSKEVEMAERKGKGNGKGEDERKENAMEVEPTTEVPPKPKVKHSNIRLLVTPSQNVF